MGDRRRISFHKITDIGYVAERLSSIIRHQLDGGQRVIWLVSGGSAISVASETARLLAGARLTDLTVGLIDERYGQPAHADSNWQQLANAGFKLTGAEIKPVLRGLDFAASVKEYDEFIGQIERQDAYKIGLLGIGPDGHTAGILPASPAIDSDKYVEGYRAADYERITLTGRGLRVLDKALVYAAGMTKKTALDNLTGNLPAKVHPAQLLKLIPDVEVYNDVIGD
jgi:6-phosphogluconolactonase/glucosamine-6-phosphate isomerase/deaminase